MKHFKRTMVLILAVLMSISLLPAVAQAASKKTVYVVSSVTIKEGSQTNKITLSYNSNGLLKKFSEPATYTTVTFKYNDKNQLVKKINNTYDGDFKGKQTITYKYNKKGQRTKKIETFGEGDTQTTLYTYTSNNYVKTATGMFGKTTYKYNKGRVIKATSDKIRYAAKYDSKGSIIKWVRYFEKEKIGNYKATITYKNGRVSKLVRTYKPNPMWDRSHKETLTFTYKKMTVPASLADEIAEQQWHYINSANDNAESFAW